MEQKKTHSFMRSANKSKYLKIFLPICFFVFVLACNNNGKKKQGGETADTSKNTKDTTSKITAAKTPFTLHAYRLTVAQQKILFANGDVKEIEFTFESIGQNDYTLSAVGTKGDPHEPGSITGIVRLEPIPGTDTVFNDPAIKNEPQFITRGDVKVFYKLDSQVGKETEIDHKHFKDLTVWPSSTLDENNSVFFYVTMGEKPKKIKIQSTAGQTTTNPSPPHNPCDQGCDEPTPVIKK